MTQTQQQLDDLAVMTELTETQKEDDRLNKTISGAAVCLVEEDTNNGGTTDYYAVPAGAKTLNDLIEYKEMPFWLGNIFKACYRLGDTNRVTKLYDLNKIVYYAKRGIALLERQQ